MFVPTPAPRAMARAEVSHPVWCWGALVISRFGQDVSSWVGVQGQKLTARHRPGIRLRTETDLNRRDTVSMQNNTTSAKRRATSSPTTLETPRAKNLALILLAMTQFVVVIDAAIVNVALPSIGAHLHFSRDDLSWVVNAYTLTFGGFLLLGGRLADLLGRRRMFICGLVLFSLALFAGGIAQSEPWLITARAVQGLGAAIVSPAALSIITTTFAEGRERNRALGVWGSVAGAGGAAGVLLGGVLTRGLSWRWVLFVNVPIGIAAAALAPRTLVESRAEDGARTFDFPGAVAVTAGLSLLVYAIVDAVNVGWGSSRTLLEIAAAAILLVAFLIIERRQRHPLMPFSIFRLRTLRGANLVGLLLGMSLF